MALRARESIGTGSAGTCRRADRITLPERHLAAAGLLLLDTGALIDHFENRKQDRDTASKKMLSEIFAADLLRTGHSFGSMPLEEQPENSPPKIVGRGQRSMRMTTETVEAVYEHGGFRLIAPVDLKLEEGQKVRLVVEPIEKPDDILALAGRVYEGLTDDQIDSIEEHARRTEDFFGDRTPA